MKSFFFLLFFAGTNILAVSQNTVNGNIRNAHNQLPVVGATIYIPTLEKGAITDLDGNFTFTAIPSGTYDFVASSLGYASSTISFSLPSIHKLEFSLAPTAIEMEEVIISTPFHQLQSDNVMKVERATVSELNKTGSISLSEGITNIAGVESITTGSGIGKPVIRGLSSNRVLVFSQGVRLENQQYGDEHGLGVSSSGIESVEVIKGPASLLYGSDALGGVLYLNPEKYAPQDSTRIDAGATYYTNTLGTEVNAGVKTSLEKFRFLARANYAIHSDYESGKGQRAQNSRFEEADLKTGIGYRDRNYKGDLRYNLNSSQIGIPDGLGSSTSKDILEPYQQITNHILSLDNTFYFPNSSLDLKLGYVFNDRKEFEAHHHHEEDHEDQTGEHEEVHEAHSEEAALQMKLHTLNYDAKYHFPQIGDFETIVGVQGMYQTNTNYGEEFLIPDANTADVGILATTHYHLDKFDFQAGLRFDNRQLKSAAMGIEEGKFIEGVERSFNSFNGAFGVKMDVLPEITARLNLATGFRAPNLAELTSLGSHHGSNRYEIGNSELENERNYQLDLSLEWRNDHFEIFGNAFYNSIDNYIYLNPSGEILEENPVYRYVQNNAELYGGETGIHIHPHPLDWLHLESNFEMVIGKQKEGTNLPLIPAHSITNTFRMEFGETSWISDGYSFISVKSSFKQDRVSIFEETTPGYSLLNLGFGGSFDFLGTDLLLQISGRNLLNKEYSSHLSRLKAEGIHNIGRNIVMSLKFSLSPSI